MTGRRHGKPINVPPNGSAVPLTISAICHTDVVIDALSARRFVLMSGHRKAEPSDGGDPAVRLLQSLILDVDQGAPSPSAGRSPEPSVSSVASVSSVPSASPAPTSPPQGRPRRRGARTVMALGISTAVLGTTGVAAAGGELGKTIERSVGVHQQPARPHQRSRAEVKRTGRAVVEGPEGPVGPAPAAPGASERGGAAGASKGAAADRETERSRPRPGAARDSDQDRDHNQDRAGQDRDHDPVQDREPRGAALGPAGPDGGTTPRQDTDGDAGTTEPCAGVRHFMTARGPMGTRESC